MGTCMDCKSADAAFTIRKRSLCPACFMNYANVKASRRMEKYRLRTVSQGEKHQLLLPLSLGLSSTVLLHVVDHLQQRQQRTGKEGRSAYALHILNVELPSSQNSVHGLNALQEVYPRHKYTKIPLHSIFRYDNEIGTVLPELSATEFEDNPSKTDQERLDSFLSSLSSATSRTDIESTLLMRLIGAFAKDQGCTGILWGHSDNRLAGRVLADAAKGRGFSLPWQINEGMSPTGLHYNFPLRDLYKSELEIYATLLPERVSQVIVPEQSAADVSSGTKSMAIEDLIAQYIGSQGAKYPNIMSNVVRTVNKLENTVREHDVKCALCEMPIPDISEGVVNPGNTASLNGMTEKGVVDKQKGTYCYGCARSCQDIEAS